MCVLCPAAAAAAETPSRADPVWTSVNTEPWSSHSGLRQHNAAPDGAMQKNTETLHQH